MSPELAQGLSAQIVGPTSGRGFWKPFHLLIPGQTFEVAEISQFPAALKDMKAQNQKCNIAFVNKIH